MKYYISDCFIRFSAWRSMIVRMWWKLLTIHSRLLLQFGLLKDRLQLAILNAKTQESRVPISKTVDFVAVNCKLPTIIC